MKIFMYIVLLVSFAIFGTCSGRADCLHDDEPLGPQSRTASRRQEDDVNFLRSVGLPHNLTDDDLERISNDLQVEFHDAGSRIVRQGARGDKFYIISQGSVRVTQTVPGTSEERELRTLHRGDYFGEQALLKDICRTASVIALDPGVELLSLDRESFLRLVGDRSDLHVKEYDDLRTT